MPVLPKPLIPDVLLTRRDLPWLFDSESRWQGGTVALPPAHGTVNR